MNVVDTKALNKSTNIQLGYDLISQETDNNRSLIRAYLVLNVLGSHVTWSRGSASVQGLSVNIGTYYSRGSYTLVTNEFWIGHDVNGNFSGTLAGSLWTTWLKGDVSGYYSLPQIQRYAVITRCDDVTDEQIPYMEIFNPAVYVLNLRLEFSGYAIRRDGLRANGRYEFILTEEEKNIIYDHNKETDSCTIRYCVATTYDGVSESHYSFFDRTYYIVKQGPDFIEIENSSDYEDITPKTIEITGNKKFIINGYSRVRYQILKPMKTYKKSYPKEYRIYLNEKYAKTIPFTEEIITYEFDSVIRENGYANKIGTYAIDSRGWQGTAIWPIIKRIKYSKPNIFLTTERLNNFENETKIKINGDFSKFEVNPYYTKEVPNLKKNTIKYIKFRYKEVGGEFGDWSEIPFIIEENKFTCVEKKLNLDNKKSFEIEVKIEDLLDEVTITGIVDIGVPSFFISTNKNAVGVNCIPNEDAKVGEIYYKNEIGENKRVLDYQKQAEIVQFKDRDELVYPKVKREILMVKKNSQQNLNITFQTILFDEVEINNTDKLNYENGIITIKKGVKRIALTSHLFAQNAFNAYLFGFVRKNEIGVQEYISEGSQNFKELNISSLPINVQENDKIYIYAQINKADYGQIRSGYLSVEILE